MSSLIHPFTSLVNSRVLFKYPQSSAGHLPELCDKLLLQQRSSWPQLHEGYAALGEVRVREVQCEGYSVHVQFNPRRITSTTAEVDPESISNRQCFLCVNHLPGEQRGIQYQDEFLILCNPVPIFDKHLTISHINHIPQTIEGFIPAFLELAEHMSPAFTVFYNGAQCGASAPDHLHFQACPTGTIPIERDAADASKRDFVQTFDAGILCTLRNVGRQAIVAEGSDFSRLVWLFERLISATREVTHSKAEPMLNIICSFINGIWRLIIFPRRKHRPAVYYKTGDARVLISPAAVDVGGLVVTPIEKDFERMDAQMIQSVYDEILLQEDAVKCIIASAANDL